MVNSNNYGLLYANNYSIHGVNLNQLTSLGAPHCTGFFNSLFNYHVLPLQQTDALGPFEAM